jgi:hypothetical protein
VSPDEPAAPADRPVAPGPEPAGRDNTTLDTGLDTAQVDGLGDMNPEAFRAAAHRVVDLMADYLAGVERYAVFPPNEPGTLRPLFPSAPPEAGEPMAISPITPAWSSPMPLAASRLLAS